MVFAWDTTTGVAKTGDAANITAYVSKDYGAVTVLGDTAATEMDATNAKGYYLFDAAQAETNADVLMVSGKSATANIAVIGAPAVIFTRPTTGWLAPTTAGRTLDVSAGGESGVDWANVGSPTTAVDLSGTTIKTTQKVDVETIKTNPVANGGTVTFPTNATLASTTNITGGTVTTATNVTTVNGLAANVVTAASIATDAITADKIAADAIGSSELAASAVTEIQSGLSTLDAAGIRTAVGLASANLDTQLTTIDDFLDTEVAAIKAKTDLIPASPAAVGDAMTLTSGERNSVADALLDRADGVETGVTPRQGFRLMLATLVGKLSGAATTTINIRDTGDSKNRISATVDSDGNRTAVTLDAT